MEAKNEKLKKEKEESVELRFGDWKFPEDFEIFSKKLDEYIKAHPEKIRPADDKYRESIELSDGRFLPMPDKVDLKWWIKAYGVKYEPESRLFAPKPKEEKKK
jgi:hypothetical protein